MPRATNNVASRRRRKKILKSAKGYRGGRSKLLRTVKDAVDRAGTYAYRDRRQKKRQFRSLWITRINAAARLHDISYSRLIDGLTKAGVEVNRKILADLAITDDAAFGVLVAEAKKNLD
jgi:large subunit ribosomal protein L20